MQKRIAALQEAFPDGRGAFVVNNVRKRGTLFLVEFHGEREAWLKIEDIPLAWQDALFDSVLHETGEVAEIISVERGEGGVPLYTVGLGEPMYMHRVRSIDRIPHVLHEEAAICRLQTPWGRSQVELLRTEKFPEAKWTNVEAVKVATIYHVRFTDDGLFSKLHEDDVPKKVKQMGAALQSKYVNAAVVPEWRNVVPDSPDRATLEDGLFSNRRRGVSPTMFDFIGDGDHYTVVPGDGIATKRHKNLDTNYSQDPTTAEVRRAYRAMLAFSSPPL